MTSPTTAGSGDPSRAAGSSERPSSPTGRPTASASPSAPDATVAANAPSGALVARPSRSSSARARRSARRRTSGHRLFGFDRALGVRFVAGADEAGRGCLAGPLVAAAVLFDYEALTTRELRSLSALNDSKQHDHAAREELYPRVLACARRVVVVSRSVRSIDARGLHVMNLGALRDALAGVARPGALCLIDGFAVPSSASSSARSSTATRPARRLRRPRSSPR